MKMSSVSLRSFGPGGTQWRIQGGGPQGAMAPPNDGQIFFHT